MWCIHTSLELEKRDVPTVTLVIDDFVRLAESTAKCGGRPTLPIVGVPVRAIDSSREAVEAIADDLLEAILRGVIAPSEQKAEAR